MSSEADRARAYRQRVRHGARVVLVEITSEREDFLRRAGVLADWDSDQRAPLGKAVERLLDLAIAADRHA